MLEPVKPISITATANLTTEAEVPINENINAKRDPRFQTITNNKKIAKNWLNSLWTSFHNTISKKPSDRANVRPFDNKLIVLKSDIADLWSRG